MAYQCRDCSYRGSNFPRGACPGCGSLNIFKYDPTGKQGKKRARPPFMLAFCLVLWGYLAMELYQRSGG